MVGWYVDVGYWYAEQGASLKNLNQIKFLDFNRPLTVGTTANTDLNYRASDTPAHRGELINSLIECLGDDYYTIYTVEYGEKGEFYETLRFLVPSFPLFSPNTNKYFSENWSPQLNQIIYFKKLGLLYRNGFTLFRVGDNGELTTLINDNELADIWFSRGTYLHYPIIYEYKDKFDFGVKKLVVYSYEDVSTPLEANIVDYGKSGDIAKMFQYIFSAGNTDFEINVPPYGPGTDDEEEVPPGTFDDDSDVISDSSLPTLSAANTGFTRIYNPTLAQVQDLARYLWTDETVVQTIWNHIKQYFEDPMQAIIGFNLVPCEVPNAGTKNFALMYIDTGVSMNVAANQFVDVDCGTVKLERYYGSALDQSPNTRVSCFLPFIGTVRLNTDEVMERTLECRYRIDICSGSCVAKILVDGNCLYQYSGHCAINIPISSADFSSYVSSAITVARLAIGAAVGGYAGTAATAVTDPEQQTNRVVTVDKTTTKTERNPATGRQITTGTTRTLETKTYPIKQSTTQASFNALSPENISNTVGQIMASKPMIEHSGSFSGNTGYLGVRRPFLIIERPNMCLPEQYQRFNGYPAMITMKLGDCKGFTRIQQVQLTGMTATNPEQAEILGLLKSGVYF